MRRLQSLSPAQVEELHDDIERYLSLEQSEVNIEFWTVSLVFLCDSFLADDAA